MSTAVKSPAARAAVPGPGNSPHAPSILLPLRFMLAGVLALFGGLLLLLLRPELLAAYHYNQYIIAVTHLLVLGWICTIVMGSMYQLVPVALETRLYSERLARWQFVFHVVGFAGMVWMFWTWNMKQVGHFGVALAVSVGLFGYNLVRTLWRVPRWNVVATAVTSALVWLALAALAGLTIAASKCSYESASTSVISGALGPLVHGLKTLAAFTARFDQLGAMHAHAHLGAVGVFVILIVGISYRLVPMFTLSEVQSRRRANASLVLLNAGLLASFVALLLRSPLKPVCALVVVAGLALYGVEVVAILRARKRRNLDWGVKYFLTAVALLLPLSLLALVLSWPGLQLNVFTGQLENLYGFLGLLGVVSFAIIGMLYKIVPFLVWYRSYSSRLGLGKVPSLADLYSAWLQAAGYWTWLLGLAVTSVAVVCGSPAGVRWGCAFLFLGALTLGLNMARMLGHLFRPRVEPLRAGPAGGAQVPKPAFSPAARPADPTTAARSLTAGDVAGLKTQFQ